MQPTPTRGRRFAGPIALSAVAALSLGCLGSTPAFAAEGPPRIVDSTVIVQTLDEGAKVTALAVRYSEALDFGDVLPSGSAFEVSADLKGSTAENTSVAPRTVVRAYVNDSPELSAERDNAAGEWVILELSRYDVNSPVLYYTGVNNQYPLTGAYSVRQTADLLGDDETVAASTTTVLNSDVVRPIVDDFSVEQWTGEGSDFLYRLYEPEAVRGDDEGSKLYPLVLALHGAGESGTDNALQLLGNALATSWATPEAQAEYPTFVIAPQRTPGVNNWGDEEGQAGLLAIIEDAKATMPIDPERVYITGVSMGSIGSWNMLFNSSDTFAGAVTAAYGPGDNAGLADLVDFPVWNFHSIDDGTVPVAGSQLAAQTLIGLGAPVIERTWAGNLPLDEAESLQTEQWNAARQSGAIHQFTYFEAGTTGTPPDADGDSIPLNGHFSWVPTYNNPVTHDWLMSQVRGATQPVTGETSGDFDVKVKIEDLGGLAVSVASESVDLGSAELDSTLSYLEASASMPTVTVADTRSGNPGWSLTASVTDFTSGASTLEGKYLGVTPRVLSASPNQAVIAGAPVLPGTGFMSAVTLASASAGAGLGTTTVGGDLSLQAPTSTPSGDYLAKVTVTVF